MNDNFNDLYNALITIVVTLNGISIPVSYTLIQETFRQYLDENLSKIFLSDEAFKCNVIVSIWALIIFCVPLFVNFNLKGLEKSPLFSIYESLRFLYFVVTLFTAAGFLIAFIRFSLLLFEYATNSQEFIFNHVKKNIDEFLDK
jgi:hypothetical protein